MRILFSVAMAQSDKKPGDITGLSSLSSRAILNVADIIKKAKIESHYFIVVGILGASFL